MITHSLLTLLEKKGFTKEFYEQANKYCYDIIISNKYDFTKPLSLHEITGLITDIDIKYVSILADVNKDDTVDDDVFGFAVQQYLVELAENADENQDKMFQIKKFLTYHMIYAEAMKNSPYDKVLKMLDRKTPAEYASSEPVQKPKTILDDIDPKYIDCKFKFKPSKSYQKPKFYKGCKFLKVEDDLKNQYTVESFDDITITDDQSMLHQTKDCYPVFATEHPEIGDIAVSLSQREQILIGTKDILDTIKNSNIEFYYYTTKFNNRKVETLKVKRFACGTLDKDLSSVPYHINIVYEDIAVNHNLDAIAKHYSISHDKLIAREIDILEQIKTSLDHPLNIERSEWVMLVGHSGLTKSQFIA